MTTQRRRESIFYVGRSRVEDVSSADNAFDSQTNDLEAVYCPQL
jgi:hypothetical protein